MPDRHILDFLAAGITTNLLAVQEQEEKDINTAIVETLAVLATKKEGRL